MMTSDKRIGWTDLECILQCSALNIATVSPVVEGLNEVGFVLKKEGALLGYEKWTEPLSLPSDLSMSAFLDEIKKYSVLYIIANFTGVLADVAVAPLSVSFHLSSKTIVVSTLENVLWKMTDDPGQATFARLVAFADLAAFVARIVEPVRAFIGPERFGALKTPDEMGLEPFTTSVFSTPRLRELFETYLRNYGHLASSR